LKPTPRSKRNKTKGNHRKGKHLQKKTAWLAWETKLARRWAFLTCPKRLPKV